MNLPSGRAPSYIYIIIYIIYIIINLGYTNTNNAILIFTLPDKDNTNFIPRVLYRVLTH